MADLYAPLYPGLAALAQGYLGWRERQVNQSRLADLMLPKALPEYAAGLAYGTLPPEAPLTSMRSTAAYGSPALDVLSYAPGIKAGLGALATIGRKAGTEFYDSAARAVAQGRRMVPPGQVNIFAGPNAKTANQQALNLAQGLYDSAAQGRELWRDPAWLTGPEHRAIYERTGWFMGPEGKWRFEIPDNQMRLNQFAFKNGDIPASYQSNPGAALYDTVTHKQAFEAYPNLEDIESNLRIDRYTGNSGSYHGNYNTTGGVIPNRINVQGPNADSVKSSTAHEMQHAVQDTEGFSSGGSPKDFAPNLPPSMWEYLKENPYEQYRRLAGEAEARATQARLNMTPAERAATFPYDSYDVPVKDLIVRKGDGGEMASIEQPILNQADPSTRTMIANDLRAQGLRDVQITDGVIRDEIARRNAVTMLGLPEGNTAADRARAMGYFNHEMYHATVQPKNNAFSSFDLKKSGSSTTITPTEKAVFLTDNPVASDEFVAGPWILNNGEVARAYPAGAQVIPLRIAPKNPGVWDIGGGGYNQAFVKDVLKEAKRNKEDAVVFNRMRDPGFFTAGQAPLSNVAAVVEPSIIRSRFAAFDPARAKEADILAGLGAAAVTTPAALSLADYYRMRDRGM